MNMAAVHLLASCLKFLQDLTLILLPGYVVRLHILFYAAPETKIWVMSASVTVMALTSVKSHSHQRLRQMMEFYVQLHHLTVITSPVQFRTVTKSTV
jgi:hypothetical protein